MDYGSGIHVSPSSGGVVTGGLDGPGDSDSPLPGGDLVSPSSGGVITSDRDRDNPSY